MNNGGPFGKNPFGPRLPPVPLGGIRVGNGIQYPDIQGNLHSTPGEAIESNMGIESDLSRGGSGRCPQDPTKVPKP